MSSNRAYKYAARSEFQFVDPDRLPPFTTQKTEAIPVTTDMTSLKCSGSLPKLGISLFDASERAPGHLDDRGNHIL